VGRPASASGQSLSPTILAVITYYYRSCLAERTFTCTSVARPCMTRSLRSYDMCTAPVCSPHLLRDAASRASGASPKGIWSKLSNGSWKTRQFLQTVPVHQYPCNKLSGTVTLTCKSHAWVACPCKSMSVRSYGTCDTGLFRKPAAGRACRPGAASPKGISIRSSSGSGKTRQCFKTVSVCQGPCHELVPVSTHVGLCVYW
jgi:hypothetical protein